MNTAKPYTGDGADWTKAFVADPHFYQKPDGTPFGVLGLNEGIETVLPKMPQERYLLRGKNIAEWRLLLYSRTKGEVLGDTDFYAAVRRLAAGGYIIDDNAEQMLVKGLTLTELDALMRG